jgi:hypothetical protein
MLSVLAMIVASPGLLRPPPPQDPARKENLAGAWQRAERKLEPATRQDEFDRVNVGARGRINAARDDSRADLNFPGVFDRTLSSW